MIREPAGQTVVVRLRNFVGDVVLSVPALRLLEQRGYRLQLIGKGWARSLLEAEGWPVQVRPPKLGERVAQLRALRRAARVAEPDFHRRSLNAIAMPWSFSSALEMRLAGLKAIGFAHEGRGWLLKRAPAMPPRCHALMNYWQLANLFLQAEGQAIAPQPPASIDLKVSTAQQQQAAALLAAQGMGEGQRYVLLCPFASGNFETLSKTWPHFKRFAALLAEAGVTALLCPGPGGEEAHAREHYPTALALGGVSLGVYNALLQRAALVVANDTGPAHMAAAVGARLLSVLGPTEPEMWGPWGPNVEVLRRQPEWFSAEEVLQRVLQHLAAAAD